MTPMKDSLQENLTIVPWALGFHPGELHFLQLICSTTLLKVLGHFTPFLNFWESLSNQEMNIPVISTAQTATLSRGERNKFQSLLFPLWTHPN